jgi:predicted acetyltransferase
MLAAPRRLRRSTSDGMWIRLVDVRAALAARRYAAQYRLVLDVRDPFCEWNDGRYELEGGPGGTMCRHTKAEPDVVLSAADLAATYLGTVSFTTLSHAGRVEERTEGALLRADAMFATQLKPWNPFGY